MMMEDTFIQVKKSNVMKKTVILIAFLVLGLGAQAQKITTLPAVTSAADASLVIVRSGASGDVLSGITVSNIFKDRALLGTTTIATAINPDADDGATLGASGTGWSDLYLAEDAAITWGADAAILHYSTDRLVLAETPLRLNDQLYLQSSVVLENADPDVTIDQTELGALDGVTGSLDYDTENYGTTGIGNIVLSTGPTLTTVNITDVIKLTPTASPPAGATEGMIYADTDHHLYYYNGSTWVSMTD